MGKYVVVKPPKQHDCTPLRTWFIREGTTKRCKKCNKLWRMQYGYRGAYWQ